MKKYIIPFILTLSLMLTGCSFHLTTASDKEITPEELLNIAVALPVLSSRGVLNCKISSEEEEDIPFSADITSVEVGTLSEASGRVAASMPGKSINKDYHVFTETVGNITTVYQYDPDAKALAKETKEDIPEWVKYSRTPARSPVRELFSTDALTDTSMEKTDKGFVVHATLLPEAFPSVLGGVFGESEVPATVDYMFNASGMPEKIQVRIDEPVSIESEEQDFTISDLKYNITIISGDSNEPKFASGAKAAEDTDIKGMLYPKMILE